MARFERRNNSLKQWEIQPVGGHSKNGRREEGFRSLKFPMSGKMIYQGLTQGTMESAPVP